MCDVIDFPARQQSSARPRRPTDHAVDEMLKAACAGAEERKHFTRMLILECRGRKPWELCEMIVEAREARDWARGDLISILLLDYLHGGRCNYVIDEGHRDGFYLDECVNQLGEWGDDDPDDDGPDDDPDGGEDIPEAESDSADDDEPRLHLVAWPVRERAAKAEPIRRSAQGGAFDLPLPLPRTALRSGSGFLPL